MILQLKKHPLIKYILLLALFAFSCNVFAGCGYSSDEIETLFDDETPDRINADRKNCFSVIDNTVVYLTGYVDRIFIQNIETNEVREEKLPEGQYCTEVISSDRYFYVMTNFSEDNIVNDCNGISLVRAYDRDGNFLEELELPFKRISVRNGVLFGLYDEEAFFRPWNVSSDTPDIESNCYVEATHYMDEEAFWKSKPKDITGWTEITGENPTVQGTILYKETELQRDYHQTEYYRSEKKLPVMSEIWYVRYVGDGFFSSATDENEESFMENRLSVFQSFMHEYTGNFSIDTEEINSKVYGICRVYGENKFLHACTQNLKYSFTFTYEEESDRLIKLEEFDGKEVLYVDEDWIVYYTLDGLYYMDTKTRTPHLAHKRDPKLAEQEEYLNLTIFVMDDTIRIGKEEPHFIKMQKQ